MRSLALDAALVPRHFRVRLIKPGQDTPLEEHLVTMVDADVDGFRQRLTDTTLEMFGPDVSFEMFPA